MAFRFGLSPFLSALVALVWCFVPASAKAEQALVAVAANFTDVIERLKSDFEGKTGHTLKIVAGSTGKLYAQIIKGAPFDVLLAADQLRPQLLEENGRAVAGSRFTYAIGRLVLWIREEDSLGTDGAAFLKSGGIRKLAIANPDLAPYGVAANEALKALGVLTALRPQIVMGENIGQAYALVATGNADVGLIALSQVVSGRHQEMGSRWTVPGEFHAPIRQDAVLLTRSANNRAARAFLTYLVDEETKRAIRSYGYEVE